MRDFISIIPVESKHADAIQELASHPKVAETTNIPQPYPKNGAISWIMRSLPRRMAGLEHAFVIQRSTDDRVVGVTSLMNVGRSKAELGYWVGVPFWRRGYATQANRLILAFAFEEVELECLYARPLVRNGASCRVLEKLGFQHVDTVDNVFPKWNATDQLGIYELEAYEWRKDAAEWHEDASVRDRSFSVTERSMKQSIRIGR